MELESAKDGYVDAYVMKHELGGLAAGLFTTLDVLSNDPKNISSAQILLSMSVERLAQIMKKLESIGQSHKGKE